MIEFHTHNSTYQLDYEAGTWRRSFRENEVDGPQPLRTEEGEMWGHSYIEVGIPVRIFGPPLESGQLRMVETSPVTDIDIYDHVLGWSSPEIAKAFGEPI